MIHGNITAQMSLCRRSILSGILPCRLARSSTEDECIAYSIYQRGINWPMRCRYHEITDEQMASFPFPIGENS